MKKRQLKKNTNNDAFANTILPPLRQGDSRGVQGRIIGSEYAQRVFPQFDHNLIPDGLKRTGKMDQ